MYMFKGGAHDAVFSAMDVLDAVCECNYLVTVSARTPFGSNWCEPYLRLHRQGKSNFYCDSINGHIRFSVADIDSFEFNDFWCGKPCFRIRLNDLQRQTSY